MICAGLMFLFSLYGCAPSEEKEPEQTGEQEQEQEIDKEPENLSSVTLNVSENLNGSQSQRVFRTVGRTFERNGALACDFTCTGVKFTAACKGAVSVSFNTTADCYFTVYIDGVRIEERLYVAKNIGGGFLTVADFDTYGTREIWVVKQSQYAMAYCEIVEVSLTGSFGKRPEEQSRFIEFYGDSVLNGSNIHTGGTSVVTSDGTLSYGFTTALALNADCNIIGRGGMGLYTKDGSTDGMNEVWDLCGGKSSPGVVNYDFGRVPDAVVVELGINDNISDYYTDARYKTSIREMVLNLRSVYGDDITIIWCYGYHETINATWEIAKEVLDSMNGNNSILFCQLPNCALPKTQGGDGYHPNVEMSREIAQVLTAFIEENIYS